MPTETSLCSAAEKKTDDVRYAPAASLCVYVRACARVCVHVHLCVCAEAQN